MKIATIICYFNGVPNRDFPYTQLVTAEAEAAVTILNHGAGAGMRYVVGTATRDVLLNQMHVQGQYVKPKMSVYAEHAWWKVTGRTKRDERYSLTGHPLGMEEKPRDVFCKVKGSDRLLVLTSSVTLVEE